MAGSFDTQQVCMNGHQITARYHGSPQFRRDFCPQCGESTTIQCPSCKVEVRGYYRIEGAVRTSKTAVPEFCHSCGKPYPWTNKRPTDQTDSSPDMIKWQIESLERVFRRFHLVATQIGNRHDNRKTLVVNDEYDVQDLIHAILRIFFDDIRPEEWTPSYAGKSSRMDFLLKDESIVVETKMTRSGLGSKEIGSQLIEDISRYKQHRSCKTLYCFVYDPEGRISNPRGMENDLSQVAGELQVRIYIVPKGY